MTSEFIRSKEPLGESLQGFEVLAWSEQSKEMSCSVSGLFV